MPKIINKKLKEVIRKLRDEEGMSFKDIGKKVDLHPVTVAKYCGSIGSPPSPNTTEKIRATLSVELTPKLLEDLWVIKSIIEASTFEETTARLRQCIEETWSTVKASGKERLEDLFWDVCLENERLKKELDRLTNVVHWYERELRRIKSDPVIKALEDLRFRKLKEKVDGLLGS
jgi:transcriptional regulator with XRE-family HTH domain